MITTDGNILEMTWLRSMIFVLLDHTGLEFLGDGNESIVALLDSYLSVLYIGMQFRDTSELNINIRCVLVISATRRTSHLRKKQWVTSGENKEMYDLKYLY